MSSIPSGRCLQTWDAPSDALGVMKTTSFGPIRTTSPAHTRQCRIWCLERGTHHNRPTLSQSPRDSVQRAWRRQVTVQGNSVRWYQLTNDMPTKCWTQPRFVDRGTLPRDGNTEGMHSEPPRTAPPVVGSVKLLLSTHRWSVKI
jgi:hypothetical protein